MPFAINWGRLPTGLALAEQEKSTLRASQRMIPHPVYLFDELNRSRRFPDLETLQNKAKKLIPHPEYTV